MFEADICGESPGTAAQSQSVARRDSSGIKRPIRQMHGVRQRISSAFPLRLRASHARTIIETFRQIKTLIPMCHAVALHQAGSSRIDDVTPKMLAFTTAEAMYRMSEQHVESGASSCSTKKGCRAAKSMPASSQRSAKMEHSLSIALRYEPNRAVRQLYTCKHSLQAFQSIKATLQPGISLKLYKRMCPWILRGVFTFENSSKQWL